MAAKQGSTKREKHATSRKMGNVYYLPGVKMPSPKRRYDQVRRELMKWVRLARQKVEAGQIIGFAFIAVRPNGGRTAGMINVSDERSALDAIYHLETAVRGNRDIAFED